METKHTPAQREELIRELARTLYARDIAGALIDARAQRDELAAALREIADCANDPHWQRKVLKIARAALAKVALV